MKVGIIKFAVKLPDDFPSDASASMLLRKAADIMDGPDSPTRTGNDTEPESFDRRASDLWEYLAAHLRDDPNGQMAGCFGVHNSEHLEKIQSEFEGE